MAAHEKSLLDITFTYNWKVSVHLNPLGALMLKASVFRVLKTQRETHEAIHKGLCTHLNKHTCRYMCMCAHTAASL